MRTEQEAIKAGMGREKLYSSKTFYCPECGCPWYANKDLCGDGHRVCFNCKQDWYTDVDYKNSVELTELPKA